MVSVESVIKAASNSGHDLTEKQAKVIIERHNQLVEEGKKHQRNRNRQVDNSWKQRNLCS